MLNWTSVLLVAGPAILLFFALRHRDAREPASLRLLVFVLAVAAAVPLSFAILWRLDATRVSIELHAIAFRASGTETLRKVVSERRPNSGRIVIGDVTSRRARPQRSFGTLVFAPRGPRGGSEGSLRIELPPAHLRAGLIGVASEGLLGAETLQDGDEICIAGACWKYGAGDQSVTFGKRVERIPPRQAEIPGLGWTFTLPFAKAAIATQRTWSAEYLARASGAIPTDRRVRSFLFFNKQAAEARLVSLDADVFLRRNGARTTPAQSFSVVDGERISFYSLPADSANFAAPPITERRSVVYDAGERSFALDLDTPEVHSLTMGELNALVLAQSAGMKKKVVALAMGEAQLVDRSLYFSGLSESVAVEANALYELSRWFPRDFQSLVRIISARGPVDSRLGRVQWIGSSDLAAVRLDVLRTPLLLLIFGAVLMLLKVVAAWTARLTATQALFLGTVELLLGVRLLIGYRVWSMPPHKLEAAELAVIAWIALPWIFLAASLPLPRLASLKTSANAPALAGLFFSMMFTARMAEGRTKLVWVLFHLIAIGAALLRSEEVRTRLGRTWKWICAKSADAWVAFRASRPMDVVHPWFASDTIFVRVVCGGIAAVVTWLLIRRAVGPLTLVIMVLMAFAAGFFIHRIARWSRHFFDRDMTPIIAAALCFTLVRVVLLFFGLKESANFGVRVSLSVLHIPAAAVLQGFYFWRLWKRVHDYGRLQSPDFAGALAILFFVWVFPAAVTSDIGLALLNVPLFVLLLLAVTRHAHAGRALARTLVAAVIIFIAGAPLLRLALPFVRNEEFLLSAASDSNYARFMHFAAPEKLQELATKRGESLAVTSAILQSYIRSGLFGYGYGHSEVSSHLGDTALRDFAPAVFVAAEWGLAGSVAALLIYLLFTVIAVSWLPWSSTAMTEERPGPAIALVAAATITVSSIYMILANHELLLLTGKNAYLLGLDSAGDVIEVIVLLLLIAYGSSVLRQEENAGMRGSA